jgi:hypothetical protein
MYNRDQVKILAKWVGLARSMTLAALGFAFSTPVWAQCAMCKAVAGSQKAAAIVALNKGIILLGVPPAAIILGIGWFTYKHRNSP